MNKLYVAFYAPSVVTFENSPLTHCLRKTARFMIGILFFYLLAPTFAHAATIGTFASCICAQGSNSVDVYVLDNPKSQKRMMELYQGGRFVIGALVDVYGNCGAPQVCTPEVNEYWGITNPRVPLNGPITIKLKATQGGLRNGYHHFSGEIVK